MAVLYVLDRATARISIYTADGVFINWIYSQSDVLDRARGLDVDGEGNLWVAHTSSGHVAALSPDGELLHEFPVWPGDAQPVDVLVSPDGRVYVTDAGVHKLIRYDATGRRLLA